MVYLGESLLAEQSALLRLRLPLPKLVTAPFQLGQPFPNRASRYCYIIPPHAAFTIKLPGEDQQACYFIIGDPSLITAADSDFQAYGLYAVDVSRVLLTKLFAQCQGEGYEYLFTNPLTKTRYTTIKTAWNTACRKAGISGLRFHDLRHTFGTRAADAGVPLNAIHDVMGHKSTAMTERYAHAIDEGRRRAVEAVQKVIVTNLSQRSLVRVS